MRLARARTHRWQKMLIGAGLIALFWALFAFFAFVPFDRETSAGLILSVTGAVFIAVIVALRVKRLVDIETGIYAVLFLAILVGLYAIPLRDDLPADARAFNREFSAHHRDRYEYARELFWEIDRRYTGPTREYLLQPHKIFLIKSSTHFWSMRGYVPSHLQAQLYRHLLLDSRRFARSEVLYEAGRCFNSPHGYVVILHPKRRIYADLWASDHFDEYEFGQVVEMPSCDAISSEGPKGEPFRPPRSDAGAKQRVRKQ
jgi:hypothetical protein